jgi:uncharacterized protein YjbI with pentapeptide repeats
VNWQPDHRCVDKNHLVAVAGVRFRRVRSWVTGGWRGLGRSLRGLALLPAVCLAVAGAVAIVLLATWILRVVIHTSAKEADPIDITKLSFMVAGGVGAAVALVVAYRRQRDVEQGRFVERFGAAAAQLGDHDVAVRIASVYAMAGVADESIGLRRQQCIDVLCGYLRLPYSPELGSSHQSKLVHIEPLTADDGSLLEGAHQERHLEYRQNDKEVRATIVRVIADHLRGQECSWSACDFDFRSAHLEDVSFRSTVFGGTTQFGNATFSGSSWFERATFSGPTVFPGARFSGPARFNGATFSGITGFGGATFSNGAWFVEARFCAIAFFRSATFARDTQFDRATFAGDTRFDEVTFGGRTSFAQTDFGSGAISFEKPRQWGPPPPTFDWDSDLSTKPENVTPESWPPTPVA